MFLSGRHQDPRPRLDRLGSIHQEIRTQFGLVKTFNPNKNLAEFHAHFRRLNQSFWSLISSLTSSLGKVNPSPSQNDELDFVISINDVCSNVITHRCIGLAKRTNFSLKEVSNIILSLAESIDFTGRNQSGDYQLDAVYSEFAQLITNVAEKSVSCEKFQTIP